MINYYILCGLVPSIIEVLENDIYDVIVVTERRSESRIQSSYDGGDG